jgi:hypothetical protein
LLPTRSATAPRAAIPQRGIAPACELSESVLLGVQESQRRGSPARSVLLQRQTARQHAAFPTQCRGTAQSCSRLEVPHLPDSFAQRPHLATPQGRGTVPRSTPTFWPMPTALASSLAAGLALGLVNFGSVPPLSFREPTKAADEPRTSVIAREVRYPATIFDQIDANPAEGFVQTRNGRHSGP